MTRPKVEDYTDILHFIAYFTLVHGYAPSVREIAVGTRLKSTSNVSYALNRLEEDGRIARTPRTSRTIVLLEVV
jgi:SOS-response transcriptional repressor LexA